jgi:hypothetical protein
MRLYIWEGDGISGAYHDDGTLVVLAGSPEEARAIVRADRQGREAAQAAWRVARGKWFRAHGLDDVDWRLPEGLREELATAGLSTSDAPILADLSWDGDDKALSREPDRVVGLDESCIVAFNGGGYD